MLAGYSLTASNMLVMVNDSAAYMTNYNMMSSVMGQNNYQTVKGVLKFGADAVLGMGLSEPGFYGKNKYVGNIRQNALYDNSEGERC